VHKLDIQVAGRPRPVFAKLAVSRKNKAAFILDIPTTLTVIPRFAKFLVEHSADAAVADDEHVTEARKKLVVSSETVEFKEKLEEFVRVVYAHGAQEPRETSPIPLLHMVPLTHWRQRMEELAGH
jgi:hypothetical protein